MEKLIYILRHGQTDYNLQGIVQGGGVDTSLNDTGRKQAQAFHEAYKHIPFEAVITSRLKRTHQTVAAFIDAGLPWTQMAELNEMGWGDHEGKPSSPEMRHEYREVMTAWEAGDYTAAMPNGETAAALGVRLTQFIEHLRARPESHLLVCSHGRSMRGLMCLLTERPLSAMGQFSHANTGLWIVRQRADGDFELLAENDTRHLLHFEDNQWVSLR
jgi:probable phosphoglycerate mutase